jgi:NTE family protein
MKTTFRNLVFEGGGVKGIAYGGALLELEERGILKDVQRIAGTSAGGITATLLALGYTAEETSAIIAKTNFNQFADHAFGMVRDIYRLFRHFGFHKGKKFRDWIGELIERKTGQPNLTFGQLHERAGQNDFRDLYLVGINLSQQKLEVYSHENCPEMEIRQANRITMSIPLYYQCVKRESDVLIDGGVTWNYPLNIFDYTRYRKSAANGGTEEGSAGGELKYKFNKETLGFRLDTKEEIEHFKRNWALPSRDIKKFKHYLGALLGFLLDSVNKRHLDADDWNRTIFLDTAGVKTTDFDLPDDLIQKLIKNGKQGVIKYFDWLENA